MVRPVGVIVADAVIVFDVQRAKNRTAKQTSLSLRTVSGPVSACMPLVPGFVGCQWPP